MKSSRMKFAKKLKSIRAGEYLNQDRILQVLSAADGISEFLPKLSNPIPQITAGSIWRTPQKLEDRIPDVTEKDGEEVSGNEVNVRPSPVNQIPRVSCDRKDSKPEISYGSDSGIGGKKSFVGDEENIQPLVNQIPRVPCDRKESKPEISCGSDSGIGRKSSGSVFRRPVLNSSTLFDPRLLEAFELAVGCFRRINDFSRESIRVGDDEEDDIVFPEIDENTLPPVICVEEEEDRRKDENVLRNDDQHVEEGFRKDDNTLPPFVGVEEEGRRKDESVFLSEDQQGEEGFRKDDKALPVIGKEEDIRKDGNVFSNSAAQGEEGFREDNNALQIINEIAEEAKSIGEDGNALLDPLSEFEEQCPPGGENSVVFYTTTLRGIRKTFDDCNKIRFLLDSFKVKYYERDVSMHRQYREELRRILPDVLPPVLFVKGICIGGAQRVIGLHERGKFKVLFDGVPIVAAGEDKRCRRCDGFRFLICGGCRGSRRIVSGDDGSRIQCLLCNENGLIVCVDCSS